MLKKRITELTLAVAMTMSAGAAQAAVTDIAQNGGFETGDFSGLVPELRLCVGARVLLTSNAWVRADL